MKPTSRTPCTKSCLDFSLTVLLLALILGFMSLTTAAQSIGADSSLELHVPVAPVPRSVDGKNELVYELRMSNLGHRDLRPVRIEVVDSERHRPLVTYEGRELEERLDLSGVQQKGKADAWMSPGGISVLFVELGVAGSAPERIHHRIVYRSASNDASLKWVEGGRVKIVIGSPRVLSPPLNSGPWLAVFDPRWERGHRRVGYAFDGSVRVPGRYAIDWVKLDTSGMKAPAGNVLVKATYSYGQDVLAVSNGVVVHVSRKAKERTKVIERALSSIGNSVVLKLDSGEYAHYGHLRPNAMRVREGSRVKAGQKIAEVGFTGSASDPQLHFALTNGPDELASEGLAYVFNRYRKLGKYLVFADVGSKSWVADSEKMIAEYEAPPAMSVVQWENELPR